MEEDVTPRKIEKFPENLKDATPSFDTKAKIYSIQVITPIFGGGVEAGENDPITLVRPSSIRGHLRFWWRATRGAECKDFMELQKKEGDIWGTTTNPSKVISEVTVRSTGKSFPCAELDPRGSYYRINRDLPPYALFPFQGNVRKGENPAKCTSDVLFDLKLTYPDTVSQDVNAAVWSWVNFGGIGARTRKGCGALYCSELSPPDLNSISSWYKTHLETFNINSSTTRKWPTLPARFLFRESKGNSWQGWKDVVGLMQTFRQGIDAGRNPGSSSNRPGRSRWPEPESLRRITSSRSARHQRITTIPDDAFPRAELGLPIVFHFKDAGNGDPEDSELYPVVDGIERTRMASPLILRPAICANGTIFQMVMPLRTPILDEVVLKKTKGEPRSRTIRGSTLALYAKSPLGSPVPGKVPRSSSGSALEAFLTFAKEKGNDFREVGL